ncbi:glycosyltransferase family 4 protein [uncultured Psychroserpens sp.]|uniref:glycosyltransferase family 4 protein n=1 Tax=uncultured Psychroserpens sp. TaxID=255436 RepID=UPI0026271EF5|nr:glycosyltransferase family 4 protein [uncultured Psychroserpens sp.]
MSKKKILITIDWFLPGTKSGGPVRSYANMIAHLASYYDFYIITRDTDYCSDQPYNSIESNAWNTLSNNTQVYYISKDQLTKKTLKAVISNISFDIAYINGIYSWYFSILPLFLLPKSKPVIVAARGMLNPQAFSVKPFKKHVFLFIAKLIGVYKHVIFHATNQDEANHIKNRISVNASIRIAPNLPRISRDKNLTKRSKHEPTRFVCIARISVEKGTLKMIRAFKQIKEKAVLDVFGPIYDDSYWTLCKKELADLPSNISINYRGVLPSEEVPEVLTDYDFFVLLSEGENFGHAILEAFLSGCPVIISNKTPWKDLENKGVGYDIELSHIKKITTIFDQVIEMSQMEYQKQSLNAFNFSKTFVNDPKLLQANLDLFELK